MDTIKRAITTNLTDRLQQNPIVALTGARQTGKTTICEKLLPEALHLPITYISFDDPDERLRFQRSAVSILENLTTPLVVLDEVQKIPQLFDPLKLVVDRQQKKPVSERQRFILAGSSQLLMMKSIRETLSGRVALCRAMPFSLHELCGAKRASSSHQALAHPGCLTTGYRAPPPGLAAAIAESAEAAR
jgi:predicted AAA+ superfamily ATPase